VTQLVAPKDTVRISAEPKVYGFFDSLEPLASSRWAVAGILLLAAAVRFWKAGEWSVWQDEVTSMLFSQHLENPFASSFPLFFYALQVLYNLTGISVPAGRLFVAALGILSIALTYVCLRKLTGSGAALLAALFLSLSFGHLFWSQSIRYYMLVFVLQVLSTYWFIRGFEDDNRRHLLLSNLALLLALLSHYSAALLMPVFAGYLAVVFRRRSACQAGYSVRNLLIFAVPFLLMGLVLAWRFTELRSHAGLITNANGGFQASRLVVQIFFFAKLGAFFGVPLFLLGALAPFLARQLIPRRLVCFLVLAAFLPILELEVMAILNLTFIEWQYAFFAFYGLAALAALAIVGLYRGGFRVTGILLGGGVLVYQLVFLYGYFTTMHGARPRWQEAVALLRQQAGPDVGKPGQAEVRSTEAVTVSFYLDVPLDRVFDGGMVARLSKLPPDVLPPIEQWYVVELGNISQANARWLTEHCVLEGRFEAWVGPRDRSVSVYHFSPLQ